jgi:hypothetical protein
VCQAPFRWDLSESQLLEHDQVSYYPSICNGYAGKDAYERNCPYRTGDSLRTSQRNERLDEWRKKGRVLDTASLTHAI